MQPLFLILGKEVLGNLDDLSVAINERINTEFTVQTTQTCCNVKLDCTFSMIDSKMRGLATGLGGAYCLLCTVPKDFACGRVTAGTLPVDVGSMFHINRTLEQTKSPCPARWFS